MTKKKSALISVTKCEKHVSDVIILYSYKKRKFWLFGPIKTIVKQYRGSSTVYHHYPSGKRCSTCLESWLCDIWQKWTWEQEKCL